MSDVYTRALQLHKQHKGKLSVDCKIPVESSTDLSLVYSPGVAQPCIEIHQDSKQAYEYTIKGNLVAVVTDGTAVLGLGDIGPQAAMPVMEGKAALFKAFAGVDAFPICLNQTDTEQLITTIKALEPTFGGINLEDISAPRCFEIEERLNQELNIPVFHDDQHGTAIVTLAGLYNAIKIVNKTMGDLKVVINGAGAAGVAITKLLYTIGVKDILLCDTKGILYKGRPEGMNKIKSELANITNSEGKRGTLADALQGADVFIGVSVAGAVTADMVKSMNPNSIIFAMANPVPEIMPEEAIAAGAAVVGTGRSDFPNQVNNVLAFPGIFRGALDVRATEINMAMKLAAIRAIAELVDEKELTASYVIPHALDQRVAPRVAAYVSQAAIDSGVAQLGKKEEVLV